MTALIIVKSLILNRKMKKALLIRRSPKDPDEGGAWESAGGKVEEGETLEEGIIREVYEETGLRVSPEKLLYASLDGQGEKNRIFIVYLCVTDEENITLSGEHTESRWVGKDECRSMLGGGIAEDYIKYGVYEMEW